ncbi:Phosphoinositide phospholipase C [Pleurostoma richardsiae]|uniref:Phosphoinositide phospholipase C n=1 Tax=Pleurostoma richardsiae TaxID=41990 RepID=A0AA38S987_9PEZI|nr:Phosphoinositide phospholipase C [Pleurostoma richardsiae]
MGCIGILRRRASRARKKKEEAAEPPSPSSPSPANYKSRRRTFTRTFTMPRFVGHPKAAGLQALTRLVDIATIVSPTQNGFHKPVVVTDEARTDGTRPRRLLVLTPAIQRHLRRLYDDLREGEFQLSRERLEAFLRDTQGGLLAPLERDRYKFGQFLEVWYSLYQDAVRPVRCEEKDLTRPISNYFISSSHNTYLSGNQLFGPSSADAYRNVLNGDCRCIEIDVWNGDASGSRTPRARSKSPHEHRRQISHISQISQSSLPTVAASVIDSVDEKWHKLSGKPCHHSRSPSASQPGLGVPNARDSGTCLDPNAVNERLGRERSGSGSGSRSRSRSRNGVPKNEPVVMHAMKIPGAGDWTLTAPVGFREVCRAIRETAFKNNPLPIIVSLEVHADPDQQEVMVRIMEEEWAGVLLNQPFDGCDPAHRQPRLEELQEKILVKVKKSPSKTMVPQGTQLSLPTIASLEEDMSGSEDDRGMPTSKRRRVAICEKLSSLAIYTHSEHYEHNMSFEHPAAKTPSHIFSINETKILELHQTRNSQMFAHNRDFFMRAYPKSTRVDSSNLDPSLYWRKGVQMVAMNWQKWDEGMMLNHAMFESEKGWVLKPQGYLSGDSWPDPPPYRTLDLKITVFAGQHIPPPESGSTNSSKSVNVIGVSGASFRPHVKCELHVEKREERAGEPIENGGRVRDGQHKKKTRSSQTDHPDFGRGGFLLNFENVQGVVEELSFVRFKIEDESKFRDVLTAWACIRLDRLQPGYRFITLMDAKGKPSEGKLLVKIEKTLR